MLGRAACAPYFVAAPPTHEQSWVRTKNLARMTVAMRTSSFSIFRKHQRAMVAVFGVLLMLAFTVGPIMMDLIGKTGSGGPQNPVIATSIFGKVQASDLMDMKAQRILARDFMEEVVTKAYGEQFRQFVGPQIEQMIGPIDERPLIESRILADEAKAHGIVVGDDAVTDYLRQRTQDRVSAEQFKTALAVVSTPNRRVTKAMLYDALRPEILAERYKRMFFSSMQTTPAQRWDYYKRLKQRVRAEIVPVAAAEMVNQVKDPAEPVLKDFFAEYKEQEPKPGSPTPGFKVPQKAAFQYFRADYAKFFDPAAVSPAEVLAQYEKLKDQRYLYSELANRDSEAEEEEAAEKPADKKPPAADSKEPASDKKPDTKPAGDSATPPAEKATKPAEKAPEDKKPEAAKPEDKKPEEKKPDDKQPDEKAEPAAEKKPGDNSSCSAADEADDKADSADKPADKEPAAKEPAAKDTPAKDPVAKDPVATPATDAKPGDAKPAEVKPAETKPAEVKPAAKTPPAPPPALSEKYALPRDIRQGPNPKYEPLWKVEDAIRKEIAGQKANEKIDVVMSGLREKMRQYGLVYSSWENDKGRTGVKKPESLDFDALAREAKISAGKTPMLPEYVYATMPGLGESLVGGGRPFASFAFHGMRTFQTVLSQDQENNRYLFWKTEDAKAYVPEFAAAKDEVLGTWKLAEARDLIRGRAEELATEARKAKGTPLKDLFAKQPNLKVSEIGPFSWMTTGTAGGFNERPEAKMSEVPGVVDPGSAFMRSVFDLQVGDVGVAMNNPESIAYVVRQTTSEPSMTLLETMFLAEKFNTYASAAFDDQRALYKTWLDGQLAAAQLIWKEPELGDDEESDEY
jgi:hypothetical protein